MRSNRTAKRKEWRNSCREIMLRGRKKVLVWRVRSTKVRRRMRIYQVTGKEQRAMWGVNPEMPREPPKPPE